MAMMATGSERALTPGETARQASRAVIDVGAAFGHEASFAETGRRLGLAPWAFYFGARAGVLGPVDADVVTAVCGFFAPGFVRPAWQAALAAAAPAALVSEDARLCATWARRHLAGLPGIERLAGRVVGAADATSRGLSAVAAEGLTPLEAILAGPGPAKAAANGWDPPYPAVTGEGTQRLDTAVRRTDALAGMAYACLDTAERTELVSLLQAAHQRVTR